MDQPDNPKDGHLSEAALEAWSAGREDLVDAAARAHLTGCAACSQRLEEARHEQHFVAEALKIELPAAELDALIAHALTVRPEPRSSPRSLGVAAVIGSLAALVLGGLALWDVGAPTPGDVLDRLGHARTLLDASDRVVTAAIPGGWAVLALALSAFLVLLAAPLRALVLGRPLGMRTAAAALVLLGLVPAPRALALDFTGTWPEEERITLAAADVPASVALERAAAAAGLGFVGVLASDPVVHVRVSNASLRDVVSAIVGADAPLVCERTATLLVVRAAPSPGVPASETLPPPPLPAGPPEPPEPPVPPSPPSVLVPSLSPVPPTPPVPAPPIAAPGVPSVPPPSPRAGNDGRARERFSLGGDVVVARGEVVESAVAMGGDVTIEGEVLRDAVAMGGDLTIRQGGRVNGEATSLGGDVHVEPGAVVRGETVSLGGEVEVAEGAETGPIEEIDREDLEAAEERPSTALATWVSDTFASGARHALLFLFGLLLLGVWPSRLDLLVRGVVELPGRTALTGGLGMIAAVVLGLVLVITIVGIPGAILLALASALAVYAGLVAVAVVVGKALPLPALKDSPVLQLGAGILAFFVASRVPVVGDLIVLVAGLLGFGAVILTRAGSRPAE